MIGWQGKATGPTGPHLRRSIGRLGSRGHSAIEAAIQGGQLLVAQAVQHEQAYGSHAVDTSASGWQPAAICPSSLSFDLQVSLQAVPWT
jgi:hypothetical protein